MPELKDGESSSHQMMVAKFFVRFITHPLTSHTLIPDRTDTFSFLTSIYIGASFEQVHLLFDSDSYVL